MSFKNRFGPGFLVAAAFIGPGTVTTASMSGASFGYALLWALVFSVLATWVLQEMAARLGLATGRGLTEALRMQMLHPWLGWVCVGLVLAAIGFGNAAYEGGNIVGASIALESLWGNGPWALIIGGLAFVLLLANSYVLLERVLIALVLLMSAVFLLTFLAAEPDWGAIAHGLIPRFPHGSAVTTLALIGTTVVPYNLFLHASSVQEKWGRLPAGESIALARVDAAWSVGLGGLITLAIMSTAAVAFFGQSGSFSAVGMATQLEPLLGSWSRWCFAGGLFAAGLSSAIAAPLAAGYAVAGALGRQHPKAEMVKRCVALAVVVTGTTLASLGIKPVTAIVFAQAFNGFLLPVVAVFLLWVMNNRQLLGDHANGWLANAVGAVIVLVISALALWKLF